MAITIHFGPLTDAISDVEGEPTKEEVAAAVSVLGHDWDCAQIRLVGLAPCDCGAVPTAYRIAKAVKLAGRK